MSQPNPVAAKRAVATASSSKQKMPLDGQTDSLQVSKKRKTTLSCPITGGAFKNPVIALDGIIYEEEALKQAFEKQKLAGNAVRSPYHRGLLESGTYFCAKKCFTDESYTMVVETCAAVREFPLLDPVFYTVTKQVYNRPRAERMMSADKKAREEYPFLSTHFSRALASIGGVRLIPVHTIAKTISQKRDIEGVTGASKCTMIESQTCQVLPSKEKKVSNKKEPNMQFFSADRPKASKYLVAKLSLHCVNEDQVDIERDECDINRELRKCRSKCVVVDATVTDNARHMVALSGMDFSKRTFDDHLYNLIFDDCLFKETVFEGDLNNCQFNNCIMDSVDFRGYKYSRAFGDNNYDGGCRDDDDDDVDKPRGFYIDHYTQFMGTTMRHVKFAELFVLGISDTGVILDRREAIDRLCIDRGLKDFY